RAAKFLGRTVPQPLTPGADGVIEYPRPCCGADVGSWHDREVPTLPTNVGFRRRSGPYASTRITAAVDPQADIAVILRPLRSIELENVLGVVSEEQGHRLFWEPQLVESSKTFTRRPERMVR